MDPEIVGHPLTTACFTRAVQQAFNLVSEYLSCRLCKSEKDLEYLANAYLDKYASADPVNKPQANVFAAIRYFRYSLITVGVMVTVVRSVPPCLAVAFITSIIGDLGRRALLAQQKTWNMV